MIYVIHDIHNSDIHNENKVELESKLEIDSDIQFKFCYHNLNI